MHQLKIFLTISILFFTVWGQYLNTTGCPRCFEGRCPKSATMCPLGLVEDLCGCCPGGVCARIEGEECYNNTLVPAPPLETKKYGLCGQGLRCLYKSNFYDWDIPHASCVCEDIRIVCSSDNRTYNSICDMTLNAVKEGLSSDKIFVKNYGPCIAIPEITNKLKNTKLDEGENFILSCEARGYPIPKIEWDFISNAQHEGVKRLPGDASRVSVQSRGGPDSFMATTWVQVINVRSTDAGIYTCVASNDLGVVKMSAKLIVKQSKDEV